MDVQYTEKQKKIINTAIEFKIPCKWVMYVFTKLQHTKFYFIRFRSSFEDLKKELQTIPIPNDYIDCTNLKTHTKIFEETDSIADSILGVVGRRVQNKNQENYIGVHILFPSILMDDINKVKTQSTKLQDFIQMFNNQQRSLQELQLQYETNNIDFSKDMLQIQQSGRRVEYVVTQLINDDTDGNVSIQKQWTGDTLDKALKILKIVKVSLHAKSYSEIYYYLGTEFHKLIFKKIQKFADENTGIVNVVLLQTNYCNVSYIGLIGLILSIRYVQLPSIEPQQIPFLKHKLELQLTDMKNRQEREKQYRREIALEIKSKYNDMMAAKRRAERKDVWEGLLYYADPAMYPYLYEDVDD